jgi:CRISPR-associated endonuclease Cas1
MEAAENVRQLSQAHNSLKPRHGVATLFGYGIRVSVDRGHLLVEDGLAGERRCHRFSRVGHGLSRLLVVGSDGMVSLAALRWLADQDASFVMLERDGTVVATTGPVRPSDAKLRRAQALAHPSGASLRIARELISRKLSGQEEVARFKLLDTSTANEIAKFRSEIPTADCIDAVRLVEAQAARVYWSVWRTLPVNFPKSERSRVPDHWCSFGARVSPITGSTRLAANPPNAILNYLYAVLESEARLAAASLGLDPGLGVLHVDTPARDSLACDLMEPVRSQVDAYLIDWITRQPLKREWFFEKGDGNCRLMGSFAVKLSETAPIWRRSVAPIAEWVARAFASSIKNFRIPIATRLTQNNKRSVKGAHLQTPLNHVPSQQNLCIDCGKPIESRHTRCIDCALKSSTVLMIERAKAGRIAAQTSVANARRAETQRRHDLARKVWSLADQPVWLTRDKFQKKVQPLLANTTLSQIASAIGVSIPYASDIRKGRNHPHPRHWQALARLVGVEGSD